MYIKTQLPYLVEQYMVDELGLKQEAVLSLLDKLKQPKEFIELAHTPQIGHLGIYRLIFQTLFLSEKRDGFPIFILNDHLPTNYLPESRYIPISLRGKKIAHPPSFLIPKKQQSYSMSKIGPPSEKTIEDMILRFLELLPNKKTRILRLAEIMQQSACDTKSHAHWLTSVFFKLGNVNIAALSTSKLMLCANEELIHNLKEDGLGWAICKMCGLNKGRWPLLLDESCSDCKCAVFEFFPDVVSRQVIANSIFDGLRVCGTSKSYQVKADNLSWKKFKNRPLERYHISGKTEFRGPDGFNIARPSIVQYFLESEQDTSALRLSQPEEHLCLT